MAAKKKSLTIEEKRAKLLELFHETGDVYQLKDLERIASKEKGIVLQSVKQVLQDLVDEGLVRGEKISGSLHYWSFPQDALKSSQKKLEETERLSGELQQKIDQVQGSLEALESQQQHAQEVAAMEQELEELKKEKDELLQKVASQIGDLNYEELKSKGADAQKFMEAANRWTDNIFSVKSWCKRKFDKQDKELDKAFGIPDDLDYLQ